MSNWPFRLAVVIAFLTAACATQGPTTPAPTIASEACPVTRPVPPDGIPEAAAEPILRGQQLAPGTAPPPLTMYGNEALWVVIPADGVVGAAAKFPTVRLVSGQLSARARRLDGAAPPAGIDIPDGYGPIGFQAFGVQFPTQGCWEVRQALAGHELRFVVQVS